MPPKPAARSTAANRPTGFEPILRGRLVYLRPAERDDIPLFVRWLSDARTTGYLASRSPIGTAMEERWFEELLDHHGRDRWFFVICRLEDDRPVGSLDLRDIGPTSGGAGLGIVIGDPADTSQGYGSDALRVLIDFGFGELRLERIWLDVFEFNERARHVYERLGFVHEATFRHAFFHGGRYLDLQRMAILREEWAERPATTSSRGPRRATGVNRGRLGQCPHRISGEDIIKASMSRPPRRPVAGAAATTFLCLFVAACSPAAVPSASPASSATPTQSTATASPVTSSAPPSAPSTPSATPAGTSAIVACTPADIVATAGPLGGAAGSRGADIAVGASGAASCQLPTSPVVALADPSGKILLNSHLPVGADGPVLSAGASFSFSFQLSNWCDQSAAMPLDVLLALGSGSVKVAGLSLASADLPPCNGPGQPAILSTTDWVQR